MTILLTVAERASHFTRWMLVGFVVGVAVVVLRAPYEWFGEGLISNLGEAGSSGIMGGLLARGACWLWLARRK